LIIFYGRSKRGMKKMRIHPSLLYRKSFRSFDEERKKERKERKEKKGKKKMKE